MIVLSGVANRRRGVNKRGAVRIFFKLNKEGGLNELGGGRKLTFKMEKIYLDL